MSFQVNENLHEAARAAFQNDPDLADGYRIVEAVFHREGDADTGRCFWLAQVVTPVARYAISFSSLKGIHHKAVLG
jgi:hypothetical protein